jgi:hypothetical protein
VAPAPDLSLLASVPCEAGDCRCLSHIKVKSGTGPGPTACSSSVDPLKCELFLTSKEEVSLAGGEEQGIHAGGARSESGGAM